MKSSDDTRTSIPDSSRETVAKSPDGIFLWIPKVAGTSITDLLEANGGRILKRPRLLKDGTNQGISCFGHMRVTDLVETGAVDRDYFERSFKFTFVRNPWDRCVSLYFYLTRISSRGRSVVDSGMSFPRFCIGLLLAGFPLVGFTIPRVGLIHAKQLSHCNPQVDWITDRNGEIFADFVGRYERIESDFRYVMSRLGVDGRLSRANEMSRKRDYRIYYNPATRKIVEYVYRKDIKAFGYEF